MTALGPAAATVMRAAARCRGCGHRRDVHVNDAGECCHISIARRGGRGRCACRRFAATAAEARRRRVAK